MPVQSDLFYSQNQSVESILQRIDRLVAGPNARPGIRQSHLPPFREGDPLGCIPRYIFVGPPGGSDYVRLGFFAAIHGDEAVGALALARFLECLAERPEIGRGYRIYAFPICNPSGFQDGTRHCRAGVDLNREFWRNTKHPEVLALERELAELKFHGLISLHADDTSDGLYGFAGGAIFTEHLLEPALRAAEGVLPRNHLPNIDSFPASSGIIKSGYPGMLTAPRQQNPKPFEIVFETPALAPMPLQVEATTAALLAILQAHRGLSAHAANI